MATTTVAAVTQTLTSAQRLEHTKAQIAKVQQLIAETDERTASATRALAALELRRTASGDLVARRKDEHRSAQAAVRRASVEVSLAAGTPGETSAADAHSAAITAAEKAHAGVKDAEAALAHVGERVDMEAQQHRETLTAAAGEKAELEQLLDELKAAERESIHAVAAEVAAALAVQFDEQREAARSALQQLIDTSHELQRVAAVYRTDHTRLLDVPGYARASGAGDQVLWAIRRHGQPLLEHLFGVEQPKLQ